MTGSKKIIFIVMLLTVIGGLLRFYGNTKNPNSLNIDEVSYGYSAYSILKTGHDENGIFMPLSFRSVGDYKNPVLIYSLVFPIAIFGLNEFSVRFTTALAGVLTIPIFFFFLSSLIKNRKIALVGTALLTISPWHIYYSRFASDHIMGLFFLILGMYFFQRILEGRKIWAILSGITLILSMYTYHSQRLFVPMLVLLIIFFNWKKLK
ncbi:MAG: phospholipid carrier-dependent glycosyltransferase [Actinobacteria bacterium]|nr:phospholipid carrier-dependent glycosyltransferase [Actinomycetota bacterium]